MYVMAVSVLTQNLVIPDIGKMNLGKAFVNGL